MENPLIQNNQSQRELDAKAKKKLIHKQLEAQKKSICVRYVI